MTVRESDVGSLLSLNIVTEESLVASLRVNLCADEIVIVTLDPRTGRLNLRDTADLATAGRSIKYPGLADAVNTNPAILPEILMRLRYLVGFAKC